MSAIHFRNFLGAPASSVCGILNVPNAMLTLVPAAVTCELCLRALGRSGSGMPSSKKAKTE